MVITTEIATFNNYITKLQITFPPIHLAQTHLHIISAFLPRRNELINFIKLKGEEQPTLRPFGYFFLININLSTLYICNLYLFKFINILSKKKTS
jgi:hypothetical protein